jgi:cytochrome c553
MLEMKKASLILWAGLALAGLATAGASLLPAQEYPSTKGPAPKKPGIDQKLTEQELRGEGTFIQFCALCHLARKMKYGSPPTKGPSLSGQFKNATPEKLKALKDLILKGTPNMPGYQYSLTSQEIEDVMAYLKTQ